MTRAHTAAISALMVQQARAALACHRAGDMRGFARHHRRTRVLADLLQEAKTAAPYPVFNPANH